MGISVVKKLIFRISQKLLELKSKYIEKYLTVEYELNINYLEQLSLKSQKLWLEVFCNLLLENPEQYLKSEIKSCEQINAAHSSKTNYSAVWPYAIIFYLFPLFLFIGMAACCLEALRTDLWTLTRCTKKKYLTSDSYFARCTNHYGKSYWKFFSETAYRRNSLYFTCFFRNTCYSR